MTESQTLLAEYARTGSEVAFRELVERYINLVFSTALRLVGGDTHAAEDVTQMVFVRLAQNARKLAPESFLGGWLHRDTYFVATKMLRRERRRQARESEAVLMKSMEEDSHLEQVAPILDEAINLLGSRDRAAILLRFFEQRDFRSVGEALGSSEDAARMRVGRALDKLHSILKGRGVVLPAVSLGVVLTASAVQAAPVGLAAAISTSVAVAGSAVISSAATKVIVMTTMQKVLVGVAVVAAVGVGVYQARQVADLRGKNQSLERRFLPLTGQIEQMQRERDEATNRVAALTEEIARLRSNGTELAKLRGEVTRLRNASREMEQSRAGNSNDAGEIELMGWLKKVSDLKKRIEQWPGKKNPELALLTEQEWLKETASLPLETEENYREAMSHLRFQAKSKFSGMVTTALEDYAKANNQDLPTELSQLAPYLKPEVVSFLDGYEIAKPGTVRPPKPSSANSERAATWAMIEKGSLARNGEPHADKDYDMYIVTYLGGYYGYGPDKPRMKDSRETRAEGRE